MPDTATNVLLPLRLPTQKSLRSAVATICDMRCPDGPGGVIELPKGNLAAMPALRAARASLDAYISRIQKLRLVA